MIVDDYKLYRDAFQGGDRFVETYLKRYSSRESTDDFDERKGITPCEPFAKMAVMDVINNLCQRLREIQRTDGDVTYQHAVVGKWGGVDNAGSSMLKYMQDVVLPELAQVGGVGIYIDNAKVLPLTLAGDKLHPYIYHIPRETISAMVWCGPDNPAEVGELLITLPSTDSKLNRTGKWIKLNGQVKYTETWTPATKGVANSIGTVTPTGVTQDTKSEETILNLAKIPFVWVQIKQPLMRDIAKYQVALLNISSSDLMYCVKANFPFYTEQKSKSFLAGKTETEDPDGKPAKKQDTGPMTGVSYPMGAERPGFINPSPEPLLASMKKQQQIKDAIREILNLNIANVANVSAEAKGYDLQGMEAGLFSIAQALLKMEMDIAAVWAMYMRSKPALISYPTQYSLKSDEQNITEAVSMGKLLPLVPSLEGKKQISLIIARNVLSARVSPETMRKIEEEINKAVVIVSDMKDLQEFVINGILPAKYAALAICAPEDSSMVAEEEHHRRVLRLAEAQAEKQGDNIDPKAPQKDQKNIDPATREKPTNPERGEGN